MGDAEKSGCICAAVTALTATASARAGSAPEAVVVDDALAHAEVHMPAPVLAVEMRGEPASTPYHNLLSGGGSERLLVGAGLVVGGAPAAGRTPMKTKKAAAGEGEGGYGDENAWEIGSDRTFAALRRTCAIEDGSSGSGNAGGNAEVVVKLRSLYQPCAVFRGFDSDSAGEVGGQQAGAGAAGMVVSISALSRTM